MKRSLGRLIALMILSVSVWGTPISGSILEAPQSLYVNQSGVVRYECAFSNNAAEYTIAFKPQGNESYGASMLTQRDRIVEGKRVQTFDVLITPSKRGIS
jgi:hypothetical protein